MEFSNIFISKILKLQILLKMILKFLSSISFLSYKWYFLVFWYIPCCFLLICFRGYVLYMNVCCMPLAGKRLDGGCWLVVTCPTYIWSGIISQYLLWVYMCFFFLNFPYLICVLKLEKVVLIICYAFQWTSFLQLWCIFDFWCYLINKILGNYEVCLHCCNEWPLIKWFKIKKRWLIVMKQSSCSEKLEIWK